MQGKVGDKLVGINAGVEKQGPFISSRYGSYHAWMRT
jgi:hypothetical protein